MDITIPHRNFSMLIFLLLPFWMIGQNPVLFTVADKEVYLDEFDYIYSKTNGTKADYSLSSLEEYLDLYVKFKLKVEEGQRQRLDTLPALKNELNTYRRQLASSYLQDKKLKEELMQEAYERSKYDIRVSHILFAVPEKASSQVEKEIFNKALEVREEILGGTSFERLTFKHSSHKTSRLKKGDIGFVTAVMPKGFYDLETVIYNLKEGEISMPVKSNMGIHLVKVTEKRPARGQMEIAQIFIRNKKDRPDNEEEEMINSIYEKIKNGTSFQNAARTSSEDKSSKSKGGKIGTYGIGLLDPDFENAAFALKNNGDISMPFASKVGWHIVHRISKTGGESYDELKPKLLGTIERTERIERAKKQMIEDIKKEANFKLNEDILESFISKQNKDFYSFKWKPASIPQTDVLFSLGGRDFSVSDFEKYAVRATRIRLRMVDKQNPSEGVQAVLEAYLEEVAIQYEERNLVNKHDDFRHLMREYEEGILLFEVTKKEVWDRASNDEEGIAEFFKTIDGKYKMDAVGVFQNFMINTTDEKIIRKLQKWAVKKSEEKILSKFNSDTTKMKLVITTTQAERGRNADYESVDWNSGATTAPVIDQEKSSTSFIKLAKILPPRNKTLDESKGYVIADYQDTLEKKWIDSLMQKYPVKINKEVLKSLVKI